MKPFTGNPVYRISWVSFVAEATNTDRYVLFACSTNGKLVYFPDSGDFKHCNIIKFVLFLIDLEFNNNFFI